MSIDFSTIGSKFLVSFNGVEITDSLREQIEKYKILGVVINESNIEDSMQLFYLIKDIKRLADYPLFVGLDLSKIGENSPIYSDLSYLPPLISLVASGDSEHLIKYMDNLVSFYNKMGINLDLSLQGTLFPYDSKRSLYSFGEFEENVIEFSKRYVELFQEFGIQTAVLGYPGDALSQFAENKIPVNSSNIVELNNELKIYQSLINSNIMFLGVSQHLFNQIDNGRPAFLSSTIIDHLLKEQEFHSLVFGNVTAIDILNKFKFDNILDLALTSKLDVLYIENDSANLNGYLKELELRIDKISIDDETISTSYSKINFNRKLLETFLVEPGDVYLEDDEKDIIVKDTFSEQLCEDSILIFESLHNNLPYNLEEYDLVAVVEPSEITSEYIAEGAESDTFTFSQYCKDVYDASYQVIPDANSKWGDFKQIIYCVNSRSKHDLEILKEVEQYNIPITLVSTKGIDLFDYYSSVNCSKVVTFGFSEFQRKALAKVIFGKYKNKAINPFKMS